MKKHRHLVFLVLALSVLLCPGAASKREIDRLRQVMGWKAGFRLQRVLDDWPDDSYCLILQKPR